MIESPEGWGKNQFVLCQWEGRSNTGNQENSTKLNVVSGGWGSSVSENQDKGGASLRLKWGDVWLQGQLIVLSNTLYCDKQAVKEGRISKFHSKSPPCPLNWKVSRGANGWKPAEKLLFQHAAMRKRFSHAPDGAGASRKRIKIVHEAPTSEDIHASRQLQQLLAFSQDPVRSRHGALSCISFSPSLLSPSFLLQSSLLNLTSDCRSTIFQSLPRRPAQP